MTKVLQCLCLTGTAYNTAYCIDTWHACEACGLAYLYCDACCWTMCSPICIECKCGDMSAACSNCSKGLRYCLFSCALDMVACADGCINCVKVIGIICDTGIKGHADLRKNTRFCHDKVKDCLGLETGNEPLKSMETFTP